MILIIHTKLIRSVNNLKIVLLTAFLIQCFVLKAHWIDPDSTSFYVDNLVVENIDNIPSQLKEYYSDIFKNTSDFKIFNKSDYPAFLDRRSVITINTKYAGDAFLKINNYVSQFINEKFNGTKIPKVKYFLNDTYVTGDDVKNIYQLDNYDLISFSYFYDSKENCINVFISTIYGKKNHIDHIN